jgi:hypothetical protein
MEARQAAEREAEAMRVRADRLASELAAAQDSGALAAQTHSEALTKVRERTDDGYDIHHDGDGDDIHHGGYAIHHGGYDIHHVAMIYTMVVMMPRHTRRRSRR